VHIGPTAFLGVQISSQQTGVSGGAAVAGVVQGAPAASAGITGGDVITSVGGKAVTSPTSLRDNLIAHHPGDTVTVTWQDQSGQTHSASVQLGTGPAA
jgi:S1-C subfamily serine protease